MIRFPFIVIYTLIFKIKMIVNFFDFIRNISIFASQILRKLFKKYYQMKKGIHPEEYRLVVFRDMSNEHTFITKSTAKTRETMEVDGVTYPLIKIEISNTSHPFYTGKMKLVDTAGRVDKFMNRYKKHYNEKK
jgi:large subunit ribosomal protein L31